MSNPFWGYFKTLFLVKIPRAGGSDLLRHAIDANA